MKLKKQKIGYWISSVLLDIGIILLVQSVWEAAATGCTRCWSLDSYFYYWGSWPESSHSGVHSAKNSSESFSLQAKKDFCPYCGTEFDNSKGEKGK